MCEKVCGKRLTICHSQAATSYTEREREREKEREREIEGEGAAVVY